jgi:hypothetical protein
MILPCSSSELNVEVCLLNGQSFRFVLGDKKCSPEILDSQKLRQMASFQLFEGLLTIAFGNLSVWMINELIVKFWHDLIQPWKAEMMMFCEHISR